ncbi:MAG: hypothetical protein ACYC4L_22020 [Chloroflexota bacterium]
MVIALLLGTFVVAFLVATVVVLLFRRPISVMLHRIIGEEVSQAWSRYMLFAMYVVGIGGGVRVYTIERYLDPAMAPGGPRFELTTDRWVLELYQTVIGTLQSIAWLLLIFFIFALIALVIVRGLESRKPRA